MSIHFDNGLIDVDKLPFPDKVNYWVGHLALAIGSNQFRGEVQNMLYITQQEAYNRGLAEGKKKKPN